jgi:hypothetical protein
MPHVERGTALGTVACAPLGSTHSQTKPTIQAAKPDRHTRPDHTIDRRRTTDLATTNITTP